MGKALEDFVEEIKKEILLETKEAYGEKAYERWRHPLYMGFLDDPDGQAYVRGPCGDGMSLFLRFEGDRVKEASFHTEGCGASAVCGSLAAEMAIGKTPDEIMRITGETILESLGGLPRDEVPSAFHAAQALHEALRNRMSKRSGGECGRESLGDDD